MTVRIPLDDTNSNLFDSNDLQNNKILGNVKESYARHYYQSYKIEYVQFFVDSLGTMTHFY